MNNVDKDRKYIWHPYTQEKTAPLPLMISKAQGAYLYTDDGRKIFDAISSWWVNIHGHAHPEIAEAIAKQARSLEQVIFAGFTHAGAIELAERVLGKLPGFSKAFYSDNGSTAVEVALKMAVQFWQNQGIKKKRIIAFENAYHGDTFGAMSVSARSSFVQAFNEMLFDVEFIQPPLRGEENGALNSLKQMQLLIDQYDDIAAFIFEPLVQGAGGMLMQDHRGLELLIKKAKESNIITIADEVMTGFGRTGKLFAIDHLQERPDVICLAKGLTGGTLPLSMTLCTEEMYQNFYSDDKTKAFFHGHSFTANSLGCAAALASLEILDRPETVNAIESIASEHHRFSQKLKDIKVRQQGTILAIELKTGEQSGYFNKVGDHAYNFFLRRNLLLRPLGNVIYLIPPYCSTREDLQKAYHAIQEFLQDGY